MGVNGWSRLYDETRRCRKLDLGSDGILPFGNVLGAFRRATGKCFEWNSIERSQLDDLVTWAWGQDGMRDLGRAYDVCSGFEPIRVCKKCHTVHGVKVPDQEPWMKFFG